VPGRVLRPTHRRLSVLVRDAAVRPCRRPGWRPSPAGG
jgi:hypothetical protein